jgi:radical SAM protein with 4Fe4S-binding SPASM domain
MGSAIHKLLQEAGRGAFLGDTKDGAAKRWGEIITAVEDDMRASWLERSLVPLSRHVSDFDVQRLRALAKAAEISRSVSEFHPGRGRVQGLGHEVWVQSAEADVGGYIDAVSAGSGGIVIHDHKTGYVFEHSAGAESNVAKEEYVIQLKIYAALYHATYGTWPTKLELVPLQGPAVSFAVDVAECSRLLQEARCKLQETNRKIAQATDTNTLQKLALPSAKTCRACTFRPHCAGYREAVSKSSEGWPADLWGIFVEARKLGNGLSSLLLDTPHGQKRIRNITPQERHPGLDGVRKGSRLGLYNLRYSAGTGEYSEGVYTTVYQIN